MTDYMVVDYNAHDYLVFKTEQEARDWMQEQIATGHYTSDDFGLFVRNSLAFK
jgi:hypothetical protein